MKYLDRVYGEFEINDHIILELIETPAMQRLKNIYSNGIYFYFYPEANNTKFEHSIGVWYLLKKFGASREEQIAGLLHDVSHKVFAHVIDYFYQTGVEENHQDSIHHNSVNRSEIKEILEKYQLKPEKISNFNNWQILDNELPNICVDRLDYTLRDSEQIGWSDKNFCHQVLADLQVTEQSLVFSELEIARKFGWLSLKMQRDFWHTNWGNYAYQLMSNILKYAIDKKFISFDEFWLGDHQMAEKLELFNDDWINSKLKFLKNVRTEFIGNQENHDLVLQHKFRVVNPFVKNKRLTELDSDFKNMFEQIKTEANQGQYFLMNN